MAENTVAKAVGDEDTTIAVYLCRSSVLGYRVDLALNILLASLSKLM